MIEHEKNSNMRKTDREDMNLFEEQSNETRQVVLFTARDRDTEKAYAFTKKPGVDPVIWLPKSRISHIRREKPDKNGVARCIVTVEEWLLEKHNL